jgi:hypothetical protein
MSSPTEPIESAASPADPARRGHSVLAGIALVLACLTVVLASVATWTHQVALNTNRFTTVVTNVVDDPAFTAPIATKVSQQVILALDVKTRIADQLPGGSKALAPALAAAAQGVVERALEQALENPKVRAALLQTLSFAHERIVRFLRGDTTALTVVDGQVQLNLFPLIGAALTELQSIGLIPADVQIPDLSSDEAPAALAARLQSALGITLPKDFGTIPLMEARRLETAQTMIKAFDILVVVLIALSVILVAMALLLAGNRRRMAIYLAIGVIVSLLLARFAIEGLSPMLTDGIADLGLRGSISVVVRSVVNAFIGLTTVIIVATVILLVAAYLAGRPAWLTRLTSGSSDAPPEG